MSTVLYQDSTHSCIKFDDLIAGGEVQANQFLIIHNKRGLLLDCGGYRTYQGLLGAISRYLPAGAIDYLFLSHQDPDIGSGLNLWLPICQAKVMISGLWTRFIPAFCIKGLSSERVTPLPDKGLIFELAGSPLYAIPAHFMHSPGNFHLYDPVAKILFTSDLGASIGSDRAVVTSAAEFREQVGFMAGFHNRYMPSREICRKWAAMVRQLDVEMIVPQHGAHFVGRELVEMFLSWVETEKGAMDDNAFSLFQVPK